jgi:hypothetical protein
MSNWQKASFTTPEIPTGPLEKLITLLRETLTLILTATQAALAVARLVNDPIAATLEALVKEIEESLAGLLDDAGGYMLFVPIQRRPMLSHYGVGDLMGRTAGAGTVGNIPVSKLGTGGSVNPLSRTSDFQIFTDPALKTEADLNNPSKIAGAVAANRYAGGNAGFLRCVTDALYDPGDVNRPQFNNERDYVAGIVLVAGTNSDLLGIIDALMRISLLFNSTSGLPNWPTPRNLRAVARGNLSSRVMLDSSGKQTDQVWITLSWDPPDFPITSLTDLGGVNLRPVRYAIIRGKNHTLMATAKNVLDLFPTTDLATLYAAGTEVNGVSVIKEAEYDATRIGYEDLVRGVAKDDTYWYAVAWQLEVFGAEAEAYSAVVAGGSEVLPYALLSNIARATMNANLPYSQRPDWSRTNSIRDIAPPVAKLLEALMAGISRAASRIIGASKQGEELLQFIENEINKYVGIADGIINEVEKIMYLLQPPTVGVYVHSFYGQGGNQYFLQDLSYNLFNQADPNAPPFWEGDEYVFGLVLMAGGPNPDVSRFVDSIGWLLGMGKAGESRRASIASFTESQMESVIAQWENVTEAYDALENWNQQDLNSGSLNGPSAWSAAKDPLDPPTEVEEPLDASEATAELDAPTFDFNVDMCPLCVDANGTSCTVSSAKILQKILDSYKVGVQFNDDMTPR